MKTNPGGQLSPDEVLGRDTLIAEIWRTLENQSVVLTAARRMGKTSVLRRMQAGPKPNTVLVYHDLEGLRTPAEFVQTVYADVEAFLPKGSKAMKRVTDFVNSLGGAEAFSVKIPKIAASHWKPLLEKIAADLAEHQTSRMIFLWDEMPMMLENIKQDVGEKMAMEVLDVLRALRQMHGQHLRMVYTGSIGLHHVFNSLHQKGYANAPVNDMRYIDVPPLAPNDAALLTLLLLEGENLLRDNKMEQEKAAQTIAESVDNVAFYIQLVVREFVISRKELTPASIKSVVKSCLRSPQDTWGMRHYLTRINTYYLPETRQPIARNLLDIFAYAAPGEQLTQKDALSRLSEQGPFDKEEARNVITLLLSDHYLTQTEVNGRETLAFYLPLLASWWKMHREG